MDLRGRLGGSTRPCWLRSMEQSWQPGGCDPLASSHSAARSTCGQGEGRLQRAWAQSEHPRAAGLGHCAHRASSHAQWAPEPQAKLNLQGVRPTDAGALQGWQQGRTARGSPVPTAPGLGMPHGSPCAGLSPRSLSNWFPDLSIGHTPCGHMGHPAGLRQTSAARRHSARRWPSASPALSPTQCAVQGSGGLTPPLSSVFICLTDKAISSLRGNHAQLTLSPMLSHFMRASQSRSLLPRHPAGCCWVLSGGEL